MLCSLICGCADSNEPNNIAYVTAVGIDRSKNNKENYDITFQIAKPTQISGGASEEGGKGGEIIQNITVEAPTIYAGIETANFILSKMISLSHVKLFVFSEEIAREGISDITETMTRSEEIRPNVYLAVAKNSSKEYLESVKPSAEINPAKYYQAKFDKEILGGIPKCTNNSFYFYQKTSEKNAVMPIASKLENKSEDIKTEENNESQGEYNIPVENKEQKNAPVNESSFEYKIKDYKAGQVAITEENESEIMGMALFSGDKMIGELGSIDTLMYNIITNRFEHGYVTFASEKTEKPITIFLKRTNKTKIYYNKKEEKAKINLFLEGEFISLPSDYITEKDTKNFEKEIKSAFYKGFNDFSYKLQNEFKSDILGIGLSAKTGFLTYDEFIDYKWQEKYPEIDVNFNINFKIERTGLTIRSENK